MATYHVHNHNYTRVQILRTNKTAGGWTFYTIRFLEGPRSGQVVDVCHTYIR